MKMNLLILVLGFLFNVVSGQLDANKTLTAEKLRKKITLIQNNTDKNQYINVCDLNGNALKTIKIDNEIDPYSFRDYYWGDRNFVIIGGRYKFFIFNVTNNILIGPAVCADNRALCREDAQSGIIYTYRIIDDGNYLLVNTLDNGLYCFNLLDLYHPKAVQYYKSDTIMFMGVYTFIDWRKENIYNAISASCGNYNTEIKYSLIFRGFRLKQNESGNLLIRKEQKNTLILNQIDAASNESELKIDLDTGKLIE